MAIFLLMFRSGLDRKIEVRKGIVKSVNSKTVINPVFLDPSFFLVLNLRTIQIINIDATMNSPGIPDIVPMLKKNCAGEYRNTGPGKKGSMVGVASKRLSPIIIFHCLLLMVYSALAENIFTSFANANCLSYFNVGYRVSVAYLMLIYSSGLQRVTDLEFQIVSQLSFLQGSDLWIHAVVICMCGRTLLSSDIAATSAIISPSCTLVPETQ